MICKYLSGEKMPGSKGLISVVKKGIRTSSWKLKPEKFKLEARENVLSRVINCQNILPRNATGPTSLDVFQSRLEALLL